MKHTISRITDDTIAFGNTKSAYTGRYWGLHASPSTRYKYTQKDLEKLYSYRCKDLRKSEAPNYGEDQI